MTVKSLQWGGRFSAPPDERLLAFGSSLEEDLLLAPFDVQCSTAHVEALWKGGLLHVDDAQRLTSALGEVAAEIAVGSFEGWARASGAEDVHGAIDARVREIAGAVGERLHAGRSRNDQVATTLLLYARNRAAAGAAASHAVVLRLVARATAELEAGTLMSACTHRQPAQPALLAFVLAGWAEPFVRALVRFSRVAADARASCPLGSAALAGTTLPLDRARAAQVLGFDAPSRNALDAIGNRDVALDLAHAFVRACVDASRIADELVVWCTPAYGYVRLGDAASTGSSLMPQKRNPGPFELIRARAASLTGTYAGALATQCGVPPSYQRDLQETKAQVVAIVERSLAVLEAFERALSAVEFERERFNAQALTGYTIATDVADALILRGASARAAHGMVGAIVASAETEGRDVTASDLHDLAARIGAAEIDAPLDARDSVRAKRSSGSTHPDDVCAQLQSLSAQAAAVAASIVP